MVLTDDQAFPRDPSGAPVEAIVSDSTGYAMPVMGDEDASTQHVSLYRWDSDNLEWIKWDGTVDAIVTGDLYLALDDVEDKLDALIAQGAEKEYKLANWDTSSDPIYIGKIAADSSWIIMEINTTNGTMKYDSGTSGYSTAWTGRAGLTYVYYDAEF